MKLNKAAQDEEDIAFIIDKIVRTTKQKKDMRKRQKRQVKFMIAVLDWCTALNLLSIKI